jgi:hypothetical protein
LADAPVVKRSKFAAHLELTVSNKRVNIMGDELSSLSNDGRIATEKSGHIFLIVIDRPKKLNGFSVKMLSESWGGRSRRWRTIPTSVAECFVRKAGTSPAGLELAT